MLHAFSPFYKAHDNINAEKSTDHDMKFVVTVMNDDGLGTFERIQKKLIKICTLSRNAKVIAESAAKDSSQVSLALIERERAQEQVRRVEKQLVEESDKKKQLKPRLKRSKKQRKNRKMN